MRLSMQPFDDHRPATKQDVMHFEMGIAAVLPDDYREFLLRYNGGHPDPAAFRGSSVNGFFGFCQKHHCLLCNYYMLQSRFPFGVIPIGDDAGGNIICLTVSKPEHGKVLFWDHERGEDPESFTYLAGSFAEFLQTLSDVPSE
jgi:hypothetical protein